MNKFIKSGIFATLCAVTSMDSQAQIVSTTTGTVLNTTNVSDIARGNDMTNMGVEVCLSSGCVTKSWGNLGGGFYGVEQAGSFSFSMGALQDTYLSPWHFNLYGTSRLQSISLHGGTGNTVFDKLLPLLGSPGSALGTNGNVADQCVLRILLLNCANFGATTVTYSNQVNFSNLFFGDLYESVKFDFSNVGLIGPDAAGGFDSDFTTTCTARLLQSPLCTPVGFNLWLDSDNAMTEAVTSVSVVPEPSTWALMASGLLVIGGATRRRRRAAVRAD